MVWPMPRNDRSDSLSVRAEDDPDDTRRIMKAMQQETEQQLGRSEANDTGGVEHQGPGEHGGRQPGPREQARAPAGGERVAPRAPDAPGGDEHP